MHWSQGGANERAPADTPRDPKRDRALQRDRAEEIKVCHPGGNTRQSTVVFETPKEKVILKKVLLQKDLQKCQPVVPVCTTIVQAPIPKEHDLS